MSPPSSFVGRLARFSSYNVAQQLWLAAVSLVATPILYRGLGEESYGILAVVSLVAAQLGVLELGFGHALVRRVARFRAAGDDLEVARSFATAGWVFVTAAVVGATGVYLGADSLARGYLQVTETLTPVAARALRVGAFFFAASFLSSYAAAGWAGLQRFDLVNVVGAVSATLQTVGGVALVLLGFGVLDVVAWSAAVAGGTLVAHALFLRRHVPGGRVLGRPGATTFVEMARYGLVLMVAGVLTQLFLSGGPLLLGTFVWIGALPYFTVPYGIFQRLLRMATGLASALFPLVSELDGRSDREALDRVAVSGTRLVLLGAVTAMLPAVLLAHPFLRVWMGADFAAEAGPVLELLFVAFVGAVAAVPSVELSRGTGRPGRLVELTSLLTVVNLGGIALLAPGFGVRGAAVAFLAAELVGASYIVARTAAGAVLRILHPRMIAFVGGVATLGLRGLELSTDPLTRLGVAMLVTVVASSVAYLWVADEEERATLRRALPGRLR